MVLPSKKDNGTAANNNMKRPPELFQAGANRIYHRKDSYATCGSRGRDDAAFVSAAAAPAPDADQRPCHRIRARSASYSGPMVSESVFSSSCSNGVHNLRSSSYSGAFASSNLALSSFFHCTRASGPCVVPLTPSNIGSTMSSSGSMSLTTPSDPSRAAYPQLASETMRHEAAKRRKKQLDESSLGRRLFEKVPFSQDESLSWSNHALPASSIHNMTLTASERNILGEDIRVRLEEESKKRPNKRLRFGRVHIREYQIILGDNPSCLGAPLSIGWEWWVPPVTSGRIVGDGRHDIGVRGSRETSSTGLHVPSSEGRQNELLGGDQDSTDAEADCVERTVDEYEKRRGLRLRGNQLKLSPLAREALLRRIGVPQNEINDAARANYFAQIERSKSIEAFSREDDGKMSMFTTGLQDMFGGFVKMFARRGNNGRGVGRGSGTSGHEHKVRDIRRLRRTWSEPILNAE